MSIKTIEIKNFKSIEYVKLDIDQLSIFIGQNGSGKTTLQKALEYFYNNLVDESFLNENFDSINQYKTHLSITIEYDFTNIWRNVTGKYKETLSGMLVNSGKFNPIYKVTLFQNKDKKIQWNCNKKYRAAVKSFNPLFIIKARENIVTDWSGLWDALGMYLNTKTAEYIPDSLENMFPKKEKKEFETYTDKILNFLKEQNIQVLAATKTKKMIRLLQLILGGDIFVNDGKQLDYFSEGTNAKNYISFLSFVAYITSVKRLKEATVIIDEPEIGLHLKMIDDLMDDIITYSTKVKFILMTHSPRILSIALKESADLFSVMLRENYTIYKKIISNKIQLKQQLRASDTNVGYFFSDFLLIVEGVTEYELFTNKNLKKLFPILRKIDVVNSASDNQIIDLITSGNLDIPYLNLIDLDKILSFGFLGNDYSIKLKNYRFSALCDSQKRNSLKYSFNRNKILLKMIDEIEDICRKTISLSNPNVPLIRNGFDDIYSRIKRICEFNNLYVLKVDIEYSLIGDCFARWFIKKGNLSVSEKYILNLFKTQPEGRVLQSFLVEGKDEFLKEANVSLLASNFSRFERLRANKKINKASGWVTEFLEYYFENIKGKSKEDQIKDFRLNFPDLYDIISNIRLKRNE